MHLIKSIIRPEKLDDVQDALVGLSVSGMTVTPVRGSGARSRTRIVSRGQEFVSHFSRQVQLEVVIDEDHTDLAVRAIMRAARTGRPGDGNIYVSRVTDTFQISRSAPVSSATG